ncbi:hypothetical protein B0T18DRAFT_320084 [Schizothecium vesticola]|uniref:Zn(2)-C6 fungal-type domain-containing protein n=1 Tax=Schizothecium vesticola TaxID=314040 RepID=A0AA40F6C8_9PEZI|nr:hypothetical protein B0T18DRAFT_320084 [Schizothecium vesticola]
MSSPPPSSEPGTESPGQRHPPTADAAGAPKPTKRNRVLLSCAACRVSKLKCDRTQPCSQCLKKGRASSCAYAPKPARPAAPPRSMTARLKRLEAMVRGMMDGDGDGDGEREQQQQLLSEGAAAGSPREETHARVVLGGRATMTYVGATHFMAMLDDIEDLKSFFEDDDDGDGMEDGPADSSPVPSDTDMLLLLGSSPMSKREMLSVLPPRPDVDRLIRRYFGASSPTQIVVHQPTFMRQYNDFWQDPWHVPMEWLALLLMIVSQGIVFAIYAAPDEIECIHGTSQPDKYRRLRAAAGWALVASKYTSPSHTKMQAYLLYVATEFMTNRTSSANCYVLSSVAIRLMLQMGLHRDPSKLPNISPFDGEMRRRLWHLAAQIELLTSFHMGLPSMLNGLEADVNPVSNLGDEDIYPGMSALPPSKPDSEQTQMTYARWKSQICAIFGQIAAQTNSITVPAYSEVMRLDALLEAKWKQVPAFMKVKSMEESMSDPPAIIHQRFGLASLYQKSRCILHRRYITEAIPKKEHAYSRRVCLEGAEEMLRYQDAIHLATLPGGVLRQHGWFLAALATYDFLIAAMIVYVLYQSETYPDAETLGERKETGATSPPSKEDLVEMLRRSHRIWLIVTLDNSAAKKAADILETMLTKIEQSKKAGEEDSIPTWQKQMAISNAEPLSGSPLIGESCPLVVCCCEVV